MSTPNSSEKGVSFSFGSKMAPAKRKGPESGESRDYVTSLNSGQIESVDPKESRGPLVIPLEGSQKKTKLHKKYLKLIENNTKKTGEALPVTTSAPETPPTAQPQQTSSQPQQTSEHLSLSEKKSNLGYGLNIMKKPTLPVTPVAPVPEKKKEDIRPILKENSNKNLDELAIEELLEDAKRKADEAYIETDESVDLPLLLKHRNTDLDEIQDETERFVADMNSRPSEVSLATYDRVPIEDFGKALLRGMGWAEGGAIGLTNPQCIQPIEFLHRPGYRTGLGATPAAPEPPQRKKIIKQGESRDPKEVMVATDDAGNMKSVRRLDDKLVAVSKLSLHEGAKVAIIAGEHSGLVAVIRQLEKSNDKILVRLVTSEVDVLVKKSDVEMLKKNQEKSENKKEEKKVVASKSWLYPNLVVRIVSKTYNGGKLYLKKGTIVDVIAPGECIVKMHESKSTIEVKQDILETVIPRTGGFIMVVSGSGKGKRGVLKEKIKEEGLVQLNGELDFEKYSLDDICQYGE